MNKYDKKHLQDLQTIGKRIERIFIEATKEAARIGARIDQIDPERLFSFDDYPSTKKEIDKLLSELASSVDVAIVNGIESAWTLANNKNNELCDVVFGDNVAKLSQDQYRRYYSTNHDAMVAFRDRKQKGLNLSDRVWRYTDTFKREIELGLDVGIRNGLSAQEMAADLKQWLKYPDMLFRRVRDEHGNLQLSKRASLFHPGQGVYRSSYMNARRLAATETNIAYRTADHERWQQLDFVVGIRVVLSNNHTCLGRDGKPHPFEDICDQLSAEYGSTNTTGRGCYPKEFKFTGWHPHCRCHAESILKTDEEIAEDNRRILRGEDPISYKESSAYVKDVPEEFEKWIKDNDERITRANSVPYFISDNPKYTGVTQKHGSVGSLTGTKLGRAATKDAFKEYENSKPVTLTKEQKEQMKEIAREMGLKECNPMTFFEANEGMANIDFGKSDSYNENCQSCVAIHEARLRGLNITSIGYSDDIQSVTYLLGEKFQSIWINAKTGKTPQVTLLRSENEDDLFRRLDKSMSTIGRYHVGINQTNDRGHVITAERMPSGKLLFYDPQNGSFLNIREFSELESFEVLKVDKLLFRSDMLKAISRLV